MSLIYLKVKSKGLQKEEWNEKWKVACKGSTYQTLQTEPLVDRLKIESNRLTIATYTQLKLGHGVLQMLPSEASSLGRNGGQVLMRA